MTERLTIHVEDGTRDRLLALADGHERKIGAVVSELAQEAHERQKIQKTLAQAVLDVLQRVERLEAAVFDGENSHNTHNHKRSDRMSNTRYSDILGNYVSAAEILAEFRQTAAPAETLAAWIERQSRELWAASGEHRDEDWQALARQVERDATVG